jgi:hypothetical protein
MTGISAELNILEVKSPKGPGRQPSITPEYRAAFCARVKKARERRDLSQAAVADALTQRLDREIRADTYRQWEDMTLMPHDVIIHFCYLVGFDAYELLSGHPYKLGEVVPFPQIRRKADG